jgi:hypothetical protein
VVLVHARASLLTGLVLLAACGPERIASGTSSADSDTGASGDSDSSETSTPEDTPPDEYGTWEGLLELCEPDYYPPPWLYSHFLPCGSDERWRIEGEPIWPVNGCTAVWVVVTGTLTYDPGTCLYEGPPDHERALIVDELLEVRLCEPSDCGGAPLCNPDDFYCWQGYYCSPLLQECAEGERCIPSRDDLPFKPPLAICTPIAATPLQVGDPCLVWGGLPEPMVDECDRGLMCVPLEDGDTQGICRAFCDPAGVEGPVCNGNCAPCNPGGQYDAGLCFEDCPECEAVPHC